MQMSRRAKRMERRNEKGKKTIALNLVSLMDIFTILVFFLLVNSTDVEVLPNAKDIQLPESVAEEKARENVVIVISDEKILVQGQPVEAEPARDPSRLSVWKRLFRRASASAASARK